MDIGRFVFTFRVFNGRQDGLLISKNEYNSPTWSKSKVPNGSKFKIPPKSPKGALPNLISAASFSYTVARRVFLPTDFIEKLCIRNTLDLLEDLLTSRFIQLLLGFRRYLRKV